jgi:hypothetical protein
MLARASGFAIVVLVLCGLGHGAPIQDKKFEVPKDAVGGTVKSVDLKANAFTITLADKKDRTFAVDDKTKFWGPLGGDRGTGPAGLKDDCMEKGYEIKVLPAAKNPKVARDVYLPNRKTDKKEKK